MMESDNVRTTFSTSATSLPLLLQCTRWSRTCTCIRWLHQTWPTLWNHASLVWEASIASLTNDPWTISPHQYWPHSVGRVYGLEPVFEVVDDWIHLLQLGIAFLSWRERVVRDVETVGNLLRGLERFGRQWAHSVDTGLWTSHESQVACWSPWESSTPCTL